MILVIGYGNTLCGDDGIGPYVVEQLALDEEGRREIAWLSVHQLTPELAEPISRAGVVVFVDAAQGGTPGQITYHKLEPGLEPSFTSVFTHHAKAEALLANALSLYGQCPEAYLYTLMGRNFGLGDPFSPAVELALPSLFRQLKARIDRCTNLVLPK